MLAHELRVEKFYSSGVDTFHDYHGGYLSYGYWKKNGINYVEAAEDLLDLLCSKLNLDNDSYLLDIGCGMGAQNVYIFNKYKPKKINAIDATRIHVDFSRTRASKAGLDKNAVSFYHGSALSMPFPDDHFTHALSVEAPEHFDTREKFFYELFRVLKKGGVVAISDYSLTRKPKNIIEKMLVRLVAWLWQVPKANLYGNMEYKEKMKKAGFTNVTIENIGRDVIPGYYFEHQQPKSRKEIRKIRGFWAGIVGGYIIDRLIYQVFLSGLCEYIIVRAEKP